MTAPPKLQWSIASRAATQTKCAASLLHQHSANVTLAPLSIPPRAAISGSLRQMGSRFLSKRSAFGFLGKKNPRLRSPEPLSQSAPLYSCFQGLERPLPPFESVCPSVTAPASGWGCGGWLPSPSPAQGRLRRADGSATRVGTEGASMYALQVKHTFQMPRVPRWSTTSDDIAPKMMIVDCAVLATGALHRSRPWGWGGGGGQKIHLPGDGMGVCSTP